MRRGHTSNSKTGWFGGAEESIYSQVNRNTYTFLSSHGWPHTLQTSGEKLLYTLDFINIFMSFQVFS